MFSSTGLFSKATCPELETCTRVYCIFSHSTERFRLPELSIPVAEEDGAQASTSSAGGSTIPAKRPPSNSGPSSQSHTIPDVSSNLSNKLQKLGPHKRPQPVQQAQTTGGAPVLRANVAMSQVPIPVRQTMLKTLYDHFVVLYDALLATNPSLPAEHALKQEEDVYKKSTKFSYRHAVLHSVAALKNRPIPDSISHPSVGTEADLAARAEARKTLAALNLMRADVEYLLLSRDSMVALNYVVDIPEGPGGDRPSAIGESIRCERCGEIFNVKKIEDDDMTARRACIHHWGKGFYRPVNGKRVRVYTCCSSSAEEGCTQGVHVFYESNPQDLHSRHPFSRLTEPAAISLESKRTTLDLVVFDCEMIYTTGGMRVARVSLVSGSGETIFDEFVQLDHDLGVHVLDFNTRFSGITLEAYKEKAQLSLSQIRHKLDEIIDQDTILVGHALENDLKTLRIIHDRCVDTAELFPHKNGKPYKRALRDLVREHLGTTIQAGGGSVGHSSVEDSLATLNLVRFYVLKNKEKPKPESSTSNAKRGADQVT